MEMETFTLHRDTKRADRGQAIAAILCMIVLIPSIVLLFLDKPLIGLAAISRINGNVIRYIFWRALFKKKGAGK
jgi:hypothetical protein